MKIKFYVVLLVGSLIVCSVFALLNPVGELINQKANNGVISAYNENTSVMDDKKKALLLNEAEKYNDALADNIAINNTFPADSFYSDSQYNSILDVSGDGVIGTIKVPSVNINLPIYHGADESGYDKGAVHMINTSFPIGGATTHSVISAHTAYPGKVFFDKLTSVKEDEYFYVQVLGDTLAYRIYEIKVVLPDDNLVFQAEEGKDIVTLVTCTPYSVNTHRLLVRGIRDKSKDIKSGSISDEKAAVTDTDISTLDYSSVIVVSIILLLIIFIIVLLLVFAARHQRKTQKKDGGVL